MDNVTAEVTTMLFLFDSTLVSTPSNFLSIALLSASIRLRLKVPHILLLSRKDMLGPNLKKVLSWSSNAYKLEEALRQESMHSDEVGSSHTAQGYFASRDVERTLPCFCDNA